MLIVKYRIKPLFQKAPLVAGMFTPPYPLIRLFIANKGIRENM